MVKFKFRLSSSMFIADFQQVNFAGWKQLPGNVFQNDESTDFPCEFYKKFQNNFCMLERRESRIFYILLIGA